MKTSTCRMIEQGIMRYAGLEYNKEAIENAVSSLLECYKAGGKLLVCGNGGSAADSEHIVGELMKSFLKERPLSPEMQERISGQTKNEKERETLQKLQMGLPAIALVNQSALQSAVQNDMDAELIFAQQVLGYGKKEDVFLGISTTGRSGNVVMAAYVARALGMKVIGMTGESGGNLAVLSDILINVPATETWKVQEYHLPVYHIVCAAVENEIFGGEES